MNSILFEINPDNDRLLFDYASGKLSGREKREISSLIESDENWREYYIDMKRLFDHYGEDGFDAHFRNDHNDFQAQRTLRWKETFKCYNECIENLMFSYRKNKINRLVASEVLLDIIELGESLVNIPDFELVAVQVDYSALLQFIVKSIDEIVEFDLINKIEHSIEDVIDVIIEPYTYHGFRRIDSSFTRGRMREISKNFPKPKPELDQRTKGILFEETDK